MKAVMKFANSNGTERTVTFDTDAHTFSSSDGRAGAYTRNGAALTLKVEGNDVAVTLGKELTTIGESTSFTGPEGGGTATLISAG